MFEAMQQQIDELKREIKTLENRLGKVNYEVRGVMRAELAQHSTVVSAAEMQYGLYTALCIETIDIWKQNRIRYYSPVFHNPQSPIKKLPWALPISSMGGFDDSGLNWVPPAGSTVCLLFENGNRSSAYYAGTTWQRNRGPAGQHNWGINIPEYYKIWEGHRKGYLVGPDDESQVFPPWNTESYNGFDLTSILDFADKPEVQKIITYPNIYGFKTPEKHMIKMVDGDPKCNRRWKRFEIMSGCGNWIMMKDDHLHYAGQWSHPECGVPDDDVSCVEDVDEAPEPDRAKGGLNFGATGDDSGSGADTDEVIALIDKEAQTKDISPDEGQKKEKTECEGEKSNSKIIGGHPSTGHPKTKYYKSQKGANPYFKHKNECRPYKGPGTPQNNTCDLPQSGIQFMSISGHTFVMDDSVEEPNGNPEWERSMRSFDFGCNNHYVGRTYWKSATGHYIEISDVESPPGDSGKQLRGEENYIRLKTATGNFFEMNDHTEPEKECPGCPPNIAGQKRGFTMRSTSNHSFEMIDWTNEQCSPCRMEGGVPTPKAKKAFVKIRTGYGLEILMKDEASQEETQRQHIQIFCPQYDNEERGPHIHRYQEAPSGPGLVFLRVGGNYVVMTYDNHITVVGDFEKNPSNLIELVSKVNFVYTKDVYINVSDQLHLFYNPNVILLLAGEECSPPPSGCDCGGPYPCVGPILVYDPCNNVVRLSSKVIGSYSQNDSCCTLVPFIMGKKCPHC
jgi:hypothetical protein